MVEFISYDGKYPCLCMGTLVLEIDDKTHTLKYALQSGGNVWFDSDWDEHVEQGEWSVDLSEYPELEPYKDEITRLVNENIPQGCCGGCV